MGRRDFPMYPFLPPLEPRRGNSFLGIVAILITVAIYAWIYITTKFGG